MTGDRTAHSFLRWLRANLAPRGRTWGLTVPIHLLAFVLLYVATVRIMENEVLTAATEAARERLSSAASELQIVARAPTGGVGEGHIFGAILEAHRGIGLHLFLPGGKVLGGRDSITPLEHKEMVDFIARRESDRIWVSDRDGRRVVRGLQRVVADRTCQPCHRAGATLAAASATIDLSGAVGRVRTEARRSLAVLIVAWAALVGLTTAAVKRSARRSARRLRADLAAAEAGERDEHGTGELLLDPVSAELHRSVRDFIRRRRDREAEVASRLEHTDQLASLGRLAAGLAHEIKNPLAGIQGALELLDQDLADQPSAQELCREMLGELGRVNQTLQLLLGTARPSEPRRVETDLREFLIEIHRLLEPGLRRKGIQLELETGAGGLKADLDPGKIRQVLVNLINNAADALAGEGRITVRAGKFPDREGVILSVEDDGPGISPENLKRIFEPFFSTKFAGTGLGLAIARGLVEQHGGSLEVESEPGAGSRFFVLLPEPEPEARDEEADKIGPG